MDRGGIGGWWGTICLLLPILVDFTCFCFFFKSIFRSQASHYCKATNEPLSRPSNFSLPSWPSITTFFDASSLRLSLLYVGKSSRFSFQCLIIASIGIKVVYHSIVYYFCNRFFLRRNGLKYTRCRNVEEIENAYHFFQQYCSEV